MTETEALDMIKNAINLVVDGAGDDVTADTHLVDDEVLDSLDLMNFLFELETLRGEKFTQINETFDDYRVATLIGFMQN